MPEANARESVKVPLVKEPLTVLQTLRTARRNVLEIIPDICTKQPMVSGKTAMVRWHMVMDPGALKRVLRDNLANYPKSDITKNLLRPAIGDSLFIAEGAHWRWQRRAAAPVFSHRNIAALAPIMSASAEAVCARLAGQSEADMFEEMVQATFEVISNVTFSGAGEMAGDDVHKAIDRFIDQSARVSLLDIIGVPTWVPRPSRLFGGNPVADMKRVADAAIEKRKQVGAKDVPDLLDLLLEGMDPETKRQMNNAELRDNLLTFIVAGHETTALTLAWALYLCAFDPEVQEKLHAEATAVLGGRIAGPEDIGQLPYTEQVIKETLRLYPPASFISRTAQAADELCGREIRKKDTVMLPIYALQRNEQLWPAPNTFKPDRFAKDAKYDRFAWLPFGDGPRVCIGAHFAMVEAQIILASLISRYRFEPVAGKEPVPEMVLTLRPKGGVHLKVSPRI
ncbi:MAG: cytochrome P450 [Rhodobacteraceae bacterium]|nr:cytochrome P450 [Paracoccaceae bacterium]